MVTHSFLKISGVDLMESDWNLDATSYLRCKSITTHVWAPVYMFWK